VSTFAEQLEVAKTITPLHKWAVVVPVRDNTTTESGIELVALETQAPAKVQVVSVGQEVSPLVVPGAVALILKYQRVVFEVDGVEVVMVPEDAIVGFVAA
jgi:co-chaperonin GroES (HSP10)